MNALSYYFYRAEIYTGIMDAPTRTQGIYVSDFRERPDESLKKLIAKIEYDLKCEKGTIEILEFSFLQLF